MSDFSRLTALGLGVFIAISVVLSPFAVAIVGIWTGNERVLWTAGVMFVPWLFAAMWIGPQL